MLLMNNYTVNLNCVVFSANVSLNQRLIFSLDSEKIVLPSLSLTPEVLGNLEESLIKFLKEHIFVSDIDLLPQLINIHSPIISNDTNQLNIVYGFLVPYTFSINNGFWIEFELLKEQPYSQLLFEVMQKLR